MVTYTSQVIGVSVTGSSRKNRYDEEGSSGSSNPNPGREKGLRGSQRTSGVTREEEI